MMQMGFGGLIFRQSCVLYNSIVPVLNIVSLNSEKGWRHAL
jgi:hypothetical protein